MEAVKMFENVKVIRTFDDIITQIESAILNNDLKPGDKLPSERKLIEVFKVSRGTLREALRSLEQRKLIQIKTGVQGGAIVNQVDSTQVIESLDFLLRYQKITIKELMEFREQVEGMIAAIATKKIRQEDIQQLESLLSAIKKDLENGIEKYDEIFGLDRKFHMVLLRATENRIYESVISTVYDNIYKYFENYLERDSKVLINTYKELMDIFKAVKAGDAELARENMQNHIRRYYRMMKKRELESKR
jgi:GntR family transcriptional repressor for pyruvate dehydrogenase complex